MSCEISIQMEPKNSSKKWAAILLNITIACIIISCSNEKTTNKLQKLSYKSKIKSIRETEFKAVAKFGELQKGDLLTGTITLYDKEGEKIERRFYNPDGSLKEKGIYKYNDNNKWLGVDAYDENGNVKYHFIIGKTDEKGNDIITYELNPSRDTSYKWVDRYDDNENVIEDRCYGSEGTLIGQYFFKYNDKNDPIEERVYDSYGKLESTKTFKYEKFDNHGNWLIKLNTGDESSITEREVEYY